MAKYLIETDQGKFEVEVEDGSAPQPERSLASKISDAGLNVAHGALETLAAPLELAGEAIRMPIEGDSNFRAPSILQRVGLAKKTAQPPSVGIDVANKLLRAAAGAASGIPEGTPLESARRAYNADRGTLGTVEDIAASLLVGKLAPQVMEAPMKALANVPGVVTDVAANTAKSVGKKVIRGGLGVSEEATAARFSRPEDVKGAKPFDELADEFAGTANKLAEKVSALDDEAWSKLLKLKAEPRSKILDILKEVRREFKGTGKSKIGDADSGAVAQIDKYIKRVSGIRQPGIDPKLDQMLDQKQLRELVQSVRRDAKFGGIQNTPTNLAAQKIQARLDAMLKENGNYAEVMEQLAPATRTLKEASRQFQLKREPGQGFVPSDATVSKLSTFKEAKKPATKKILDSLERETGVDFKDKVKLANYRAEFEPGERSRGGARTLTGSLFGLAMEPFVPGPPGVSTLVGGAAGRAADYYGGAMAGKIIDTARQGRTAISDLVNLVRAGAKKNDLDILIEMARRYSPIISMAYRGSR